jgi:hypothetical protein
MCLLRTRGIFRDIGEPSGPSQEIASKLHKLSRLISATVVFLLLERESHMQSPSLNRYRLLKPIYSEKHPILIAKYPMNDYASTSHCPCFSPWVTQTFDQLQPLVSLHFPFFTVSPCLLHSASAITVHDSLDIHNLVDFIPRGMPPKNIIV